MTKLFLKISQKSQKNACARVSFLKKFQASGNFIKKEASVLLKKRQVFLLQILLKKRQVFPINFVKYLITHFYRTPPAIAF